jgi:microsomal prostaglandin-E synthase 2
MQIVAKRLKKKYNIENEREAIYECGNEFINSFEKGKKFCGGDSPNLADLGVFGILTSIEGLRTFNDLVNQNPHLGQWYDEMKIRVNS